MEGDEWGKRIETRERGLRAEESGDRVRRSEKRVRR